MSKDPQDNVPENWGWDWTSETMEEHALAHAPKDRGRDPRRKAGSYEQASSQKSYEDYAYQKEMNASGLAGPYDASYYAKHARRESNNPNSPVLKPVEGKYRKYPEGPALGGKHGKSWNGKD